MARVKISEHTAKSLLYPVFNLEFNSISLTNNSTIPHSLTGNSYVLKVDQGIKKRGKLGLVKIRLDKKQILSQIKTWNKAGWSQFLVEPLIPHVQSDEHYLALERTRIGWTINWSDHGGVEVESAWDQIQTVSISRGSKKIETPGFEGLIEKLLPFLDKYHIAFLEINPLIVQGSRMIPLDMACEIDDTANVEDIPTITDRNVSNSEKAVAFLDATTPASLKFRLIHPEGSIWVLLSGGGASLVIADEVADKGMGSSLANYGEYSGAPSTDDVYSYAKIILEQMLSSKSKTSKALIIAGGVANFTDVASTFRGLIRALDDHKKELLKAKVKIFVRRGGPNEVKGLGTMRDFLKRADLLGSVHGHETTLTVVIAEAKQYLVGTTLAVARKGKL